LKVFSRFTRRKVKHEKCVSRPLERERRAENAIIINHKAFDKTRKGVDRPMTEKAQPIRSKTHLKRLVIKKRSQGGNHNQLEKVVCKKQSKINYFVW
jgi:hypothetical protein